MDPIDEELRLLTPFPDAMQKAVVEMLRHCSLNGFTVLGLAVKLEPLTFTVIGNVSQKDMDLVQLFRLYADMMESKRGNIIEVDITPNPNAN